MVGCEYYILMYIFIYISTIGLQWGLIRAVCKPMLWTGTYSNLTNNYGCTLYDTDATWWLGVYLLIFSTLWLDFKHNMILLSLSIIETCKIPVITAFYFHLPAVSYIIAWFPIGLGSSLLYWGLRSSVQSWASGFMFYLHEIEGEVSNVVGYQLRASLPIWLKARHDLGISNSDIYIGWMRDYWNLILEDAPLIVEHRWSRL